MHGIDFLSIRDGYQYNYLETTIVAIKPLSSQICFYHCYCYYGYCYCYCPCQCYCYCHSHYCCHCYY